MTVKKEMQVIFLVIDEFAALRIVLDKKEFAEINDSLRRIILMGRAANIHYQHAYKRPEARIRWAIRDNYPVRIGLGNPQRWEFLRWYLYQRAIQ